MSVRISTVVTACLAAAVIAVPSSTRAQVTNLVVSGPLRLQVDVPAANATVFTPFAVGGWAIDELSAAGSGIDTVHVWAQPSTGAPIFLGAATMGGGRPDVGAIFG